MKLPALVGLGILERSDDAATSGTRSRSSVLAEWRAGAGTCSCGAGTCSCGSGPERRSGRSAR